MFSLIPRIEVDFSPRDLQAVIFNYRHFEAQQQLRKGMEWVKDWMLNNCHFRVVGNASEALPSFTKFVADCPCPGTMCLDKAKSCATMHLFAPP